MNLPSRQPALPRARAPLPDISGLENQIEQLQNQANTLEVQVSNYEAEITDLQQQVSTLQNDKNEIYDVLYTKNDEIYYLTAETDSLKYEINYLTAETDDLKYEIKNLEAQVLNLSTRTESVFVSASFSRPEDTSSLLQHWIGRANKTIQVMVMLITQDELADALIEAYDRGVDVEVIIDDDWYYSSGSNYQEILDAGIDIRGDDRGGLMHHKVMIIDSSVIVIGSYNWSASAEYMNDENIIILKSTTITETYLEEFDRIWSQTTPPTQQAEQPEEEPAPPKVTYVGSKNSDVYHYPSCTYAKRIKAENKVYFSSPEEARAEGYRPCKVCKPP